MPYDSVDAETTYCYCTLAVKFSSSPLHGRCRLDLSSSSQSSNQQIHNIPSVVASCSQLLTLQAYTHGTPFSVCIDTGADCNLLREEAYLKLRQLYNVSLIPCAKVFQAVQGSFLNVIGSVILPMSFHAQDYTFNATFYVVKHFALMSDALLGYELLAHQYISIFPARHSIIFEDVIYTAKVEPVSLLKATSRRVRRQPDYCCT